MASQELIKLLSEDTFARLFPVGKDANNERGITSLFLATLPLVKSYASGVLNSVGKKIGSRTKIECHTEITFPKEMGSDRPDGLILLKNGKNIIWTALIEAKIGKAELKEEQIVRYLEIAKDFKIDAVITISNQFAVLPTHHPLKVPKKLTKSTDLFHWSWTFLRTQADYQMKAEDKIEPNQKYVLSELIRFFSHPSSGVHKFDSMNTEWREVCVKVKNQEKLSKTSEEVLNSISAWHQEQRDIALMLTKRLVAPVSIKLNKIHMDDPEQRIKDDAGILCEKESLFCQFDISNAASLLFVEASLTNRTVNCSMELLAPADKQTTSGKVNWLIRQFSKIELDGIRIGARWPRRTNYTWSNLEELKENPNLIQGENTKIVPQRFIVQTVLDLAGKFSGPRTFIEGLEKTVSAYYHNVGENLKAWVPPAPKFENESKED